MTGIKEIERHKLFQRWTQRGRESWSSVVRETDYSSRKLAASAVLRPESNWHRWSRPCICWRASSLRCAPARLRLNGCICAGCICAGHRATTIRDDLVLSFLQKPGLHWWKNRKLRLGSTDFVVPAFLQFPRRERRTRSAIFSHYNSILRLAGLELLPRSSVSKTYKKIHSFPVCWCLLNVRQEYNISIECFISFSTPLWIHLYLVNWQKFYISALNAGAI